MGLYCMPVATNVDAGAVQVDASTADADAEAVDAQTSGPDAGGVRACLCDPSRCGDRKKCSIENEPCRPFECSTKVLCEHDTDYCVDGKCFPLDGTCPASCPELKYPNQVKVQCEQGSCRTRPAPESRVIGIDKPDIPVEQPTPGTSYDLSSDPDPTFRWRGTSSPVILLALPYSPEMQSADLPKRAFWGAAVPGGVFQVHWSEGHPIVDGVWQAEGAGPPPAGTYQLQVQEVSEGKLSKASLPVPFAVGPSPWPQSWAACTTPEDCKNPGVPLTCLYGSCRQLCASDKADCGDKTCSRLDQGVRVCAP